MPPADEALNLGTLLQLSGSASRDGLTTDVHALSMSWVS